MHGVVVRRACVAVRGGRDINKLERVRVAARVGGLQRRGRRLVGRSVSIVVARTRGSMKVVSGRPIEVDLIVGANGQGAVVVHASAQIILPCDGMDDVRSAAEWDPKKHRRSHPIGGLRCAHRLWTLLLPRLLSVGLDVLMRVCHLRLCFCRS